MRTARLSLAALSLAVLVAVGLALAAPAAAGPNLAGPSGLILLPIARIEGGFALHTVDGIRFAKLTVPVIPGTVELGGMNDRRAGTVAYNAKLALIAENGMCPAISVGAYDFSSPDADASQYFVVSKTIELIGLSVHGGYMKRGRLKSLQSLLNYRNPVSVWKELQGTEQKAFFALEYPVLPLITLMGEYVDETVNAGVRISPFDSLCIDWDYLDVRNANNLKDRRLVNIQYRFGF